MAKAPRGFTLIEMLVVIAIIAILALIAMPNYTTKIIRDQIVEGSALSTIAKTPISTYWSTTKTLPPDNASVSLPVADKIVNNFVKAVTVQNGVINITFGNRASGLIKDKVLSLRPAVVEDSPVVPITWVCGFAAAPEKMTVKGDNKTDIPKEYLPYNCR
jgi:type IV pilus assembly protein PilA